MARTTTSGGVPVRVRRRMNDHETMTVEVAETNETRHLVEYDSAALREALSVLPVGTRIPLRMDPVAGRGSVWRALELCERRGDEREAGRTPPDRETVSSR